MPTKRFAHYEPELPSTPLLAEALFGAELLLLHVSPVYYGLGIPRGDGSPVIVIPGFFTPEAYLFPLQNWLTRIGYQAYFSGIGFNADCPNLIVQRQLNDTINRALDECGMKVHLIGHSLGGVIARAIAAQRPADVASVITLAAPFRGTVAHPSIMKVAEQVRECILQEHGEDVLPECYTEHCTCEFADSARRCLSSSVLETSIYTESDGIVDWKCCQTQTDADYAVSGTHIGLAFNPTVYRIIAKRLSESVERQ